MASAQMACTPVVASAPVVCPPKPKAPTQAPSSGPSRSTTAPSTDVPRIVINNVVKPEMRQDIARALPAEQSSKDFWDGLIAIGTMSLAFVTGGLWFATYRLGRDAKSAAAQQALEMERQLRLAEAANKIARDEFQSVHRPRLQVRREQVRYNERDNGINLVLANVGDLPADKVMANVNLRIVPAGESARLQMESLPPYNNLAVNISEERQKRGVNGELDADERTYWYFPFTEITTASMERVTRLEDVLCFFGHLSFLGPDGVLRRSAFFRTYDPHTDTFIPSGDPDYEHH